MLETGILLGIFTFVFLGVCSFFIYNKWLLFKDLHPGDVCGRFVNTDTNVDVYMEEIVKVDVDEHGYTTKIYTKENAYTFIELLIGKIVTLYE